MECPKIWRDKGAVVHNIIRSHEREGYASITIENVMGLGAICPLGSAGSESCLAMAEYSERTVRRPVSNEVMSVKCSWKSEHDLIKKVFFFSFFFPFFLRNSNQQKQWSLMAFRPSCATTDYGRLFSSKSQTFGLGQTNWADKFWGIFGWFIRTHFGIVSPLSMFSINQPLFLQITKPLYPNPKYLFGIEIRIWAARN